MRTTTGGGHALGEEAAGVVQQAVSTAARRGHAQVTPLHIASAMLSVASSAVIFRAACIIRSNSSHTLQLQLQHGAFQLCLNLALDRLAVQAAGTAMASAAAAKGGARLDPVPSNAFEAALKRTQAHRRRGDKQVGVEQLVLAILDDPSVHRVMRAAGFFTEQSGGTAGGQPSSSLHTHHGSQDMVPYQL